MIKIFQITLLFFMFPIILVSQNLEDNLNDSLFDKHNTNNQAFIYGKLKVFPNGKFESGTSLYINDSLDYFNVSFQSNGYFSFFTEKAGVKNIKIDLSGPSFSKIRYYPIVINNVNFMHDTVNLGIIPVVVDTFGYWEEWGNTIKQNIFDRKKYFWTREVYDIENRLIIENELNNVYNSFCIECSPIFITERKYTSDKKTFSSFENREMIIDYQEILALSEYFDFSFAHADSFALGYINFMKKIPDNNFCVKFNKTAISYKFPDHFLTPDSVKVLSNNQFLGYDEDSVPTFYFPNYPELHCGLYHIFKTDVLNAIELSEEERTRINNELIFYIEVNKTSQITELKLLSLVDSKNRFILNPILDKFKKNYKLLPTRARWRSNELKAALYINLSN